MIFIPLTIVVWTYIQVQWHQMLPKRGRRRTLTLFFTRLIIIFVVMWTPALVFVFLGGTWSSAWVAWAGGVWANLQGAASGIAAILKPDIRRAVRNLLPCFDVQEEATQTYRVAIQSVSAVLENAPSEHSDRDNDEPTTVPRATAPQTTEVQDLSDTSPTMTADNDPDQQPPLPPPPLMTSELWQRRDVREGDPLAHWPSQRPLRQNPRLVAIHASSANNIEI